MSAHVTAARMQRALRTLACNEKSRRAAAAACLAVVSGAGAMSVGKRWAVAQRNAARAFARLSRALARHAPVEGARESLAVIGDALAAAHAGVGEFEALNARLCNHVQAWHAAEVRRAATATVALAQLRECEAAAVAGVSASTAFSPLASANGVAAHAPNEPACWLHASRLSAPLSDLLNYEHPPIAPGSSAPRARPARRAPGSTPT